MAQTEPVKAAGAKTAPPNPTDLLQDEVAKLLDLVNNLNATAGRIHEGLYGEYEDRPRPEEDDEAEMPGRISAVKNQVRHTRDRGEHTLRILESLENNI